MYEMESDADFLKRVHECVPFVEDWNRLFTLALRGAETQWRPVAEAEHGEEVLLGWFQGNGLGGQDWTTEVGTASWGWRRGSIANMSIHSFATHFIPLTALGEPK
jgi:hypothetical protein